MSGVILKPLLSHAAREVKSFKIYGMYFASLYLAVVLTPAIMIGYFWPSFNLPFGLVTAYFASFAGYKIICDVFLQKYQRVFTEREYIIIFRYGYWIALAIQVLAFQLYLIFDLVFIPVGTLFSLAMFMTVVYAWSALLLYAFAFLTFEHNVEKMHLKWEEQYKKAVKVEPKVT